MSPEASPEKTGRELGRRIEAWLDRLQPLPAVRARREFIEGLMADMDGALEHLERGVVVCLVGATGAGKSTLINALAGAPIAQSGIQRPTTTSPVVYAPEDADDPRLTAWQSDTTLGGVSVHRYVVGPQAPWAGQVFIDAPDVNSVATVHRDRVHTLVRDADVLLVVAHRQSVAEHATLSFLDTWHDRRRLLFVLNRTDELTPASRDAVVTQMRELLSARWGISDPVILTVSARQALDAPGEGTLGPLVDALRSLSDKTVVRGIRRRRVVGVLARLAREIATVRDKVQPDLHGLADAVGTGLSAAFDDLDAEIDARLTLHRVDLAAQLADHAGKRWHGPGGLLLRAGTLTGLSTGAGAMVARRSLIGAAAVVGAGALADRGQQHLRQLRIASGQEVVPHEATLRRAVAAKLTDPRSRLVRLGLDAHLDLDPGVLAQRLGYTLGEAWQVVVDKELPEASTVAVPWWMRWTVDLPVLAAAAWVVWRVADGYLVGDHEGSEFLIDTAVLVAAYALLARTLVLAWVRRRSSQLVDTAREHLVTAMRREADEIVGEVSRMVKPMEQALDGLTAAPERMREERTSR